MGDALEPPTDDLQSGPDWRFLQLRNRLALLWSTCVFLGALSISLTGELNLGRSILPVLLMVGYAWYGGQLSGKNTQRFADSVYFLGFLWTLWALIDALVLRRQTVSADSMFVAFGYALITTASGMFLRLLLMQFHYTIPDQLTDARKDIEHDLFAFSTAIRANVEELNLLHARTGTALDQWTQGLGQMTRAFELAVQDSYLRVANNTAAELGTVIASMTSNARAFGASVEALGDQTGTMATQLRSGATRVKNAGEKLDAALTLIGERLDDFSRRVHAIDAPPGLLSNKLDAIVIDLQAEAGRLSQGIARTAQVISEHIPRLTTHLTSLPQKADFDRVFADHVRVLEELVLRYGDVATRAETLQTNVNHVLATVGTVARAVDETGQKIAGASANGDRYLHATAAAVQGVKEASTKLDGTITEVIAFIERRLQEKS